MREVRFIHCRCCCFERAGRPRRAKPYCAHGFHLERDPIEPTVVLGEEEPHQGRDQRRCGRNCWRRARCYSCARLVCCSCIRHHESVVSWSAICDTSHSVLRLVALSLQWCTVSLFCVVGLAVDVASQPLVVHFPLSRVVHPRWSVKHSAPRNRSAI